MVIRSVELATWSNFKFSEAPQYRRADGPSTAASKRWASQVTICSHYDYGLYDGVVVWYVKV